VFHKCEERTLTFAFNLAKFEVNKNQQVHTFMKKILFALLSFGLNEWRL